MQKLGFSQVTKIHKLFQGKLQKGRKRIAFTEKS